jgi:hypothetical protein
MNLRRVFGRECVAQLHRVQAPAAIPPEFCGIFVRFRPIDSARSFYFAMQQLFGFDER